MTSTVSRTVHRHAAPAPRPAAPQLPPPPAPSPLTTRRTRLAGRWRYDRLSGEWEWSEEMAALHGLGGRHPGPCTEALVAAQHPDDRPRTIDALSAAVTGAQAFCLEVRLATGSGDERPVVFLGEPQLDDDGAVTAVEGLVVEAPSGSSRAAEERIRALETEVEQLRTAMASRAPIEQAKGVLMLLTGCGDQVAFDLLAHISSHTHRKVREVAVDLVSSASGHGVLPADVRAILRDACPPDRRVP
ncbi:ANTAR domain-containing protein [Geodermatophilus dictyosporus]|uniref:ANTAR domain-containing protein n=1 Tax=Geodermatophilus dictyosporus TaxID=1523247 RepID=A0A1I5N623_9ACTN|nr:ANTAR domain-containing protein [Geodermatophilus dictyosporus]SFP17170.1 ANTAR domain-containing protein [Geodermatophilus dictyosporus]